MFSETFKPFYPTQKYYYEYEDAFVTADTLNHIISHIDDIGDRINQKRKDSKKGIHIYLDAIYNLVEQELELLRELQVILNKFTNEGITEDKKQWVKHVLDADLNIIPVVQLRKNNICKYEFGLDTDSELNDYMGKKEKLQELFEKEAKEKEDSKEKEDAEIIKERRESVLKFEHPKGYVDKEGDYRACIDCCNCGERKYGKHGCEYTGAICTPFDRKELDSVVRSFVFRAKTKKHFEDLNKVDPYDYPQMKESKKMIHAEMIALYKVFKRRRNGIPMAILVPK